VTTPNKSLDATEEAIAEYTSESSPGPPYLKVLAAKYSVLTLPIDWDHIFGLRADGEIVLVPSEESDEIPAVEHEERLIGKTFDRWQRVHQTHPRQ
jgi:hypothetical protein